MLLLPAAFLLCKFPAPAQVKEVRRFLIFNELGFWSPGVAAINKEIFAVLEKSPYQIEFYSEDLDTSLFPDEASQSEIRNWYFYKYRDRKPDLIVGVGHSPLNVLTDSHDSVSRILRIVF